MAYQAYAPIEIQAAKVPQNQSNFPIPVYGILSGAGGEADLRSAPNGGEIQNTDAAGTIYGDYTVPADLVFAPNDDGSAPYDHEIEKYNAATGEILAWVRIPTILAAGQTFYMCFADDGVGASQENIGAVWEANYKLVMHMGQVAAAMAKDSSGNGHHATSVIGNPLERGAAISGFGGYSCEFTNNDAYIYLDHADFDMTDYCFEALVKAHTYEAAGRILVMGNATHGYYFWQAGATNWRGGSYKAGTGAFSTNSAGTDLNTRSLSFRERSRFVECLVDGVMGGSAGSADAGNTTPGEHGHIGLGPTHVNGFHGDMQELRWSDVTRTDDWLLTTHNSYDTATFLSIGAQVGTFSPVEAGMQSIWLGMNF